MCGKSVLPHYTEPFYSIRLWGTNSKLYSIPGGSMKSKCTRSSIPSFLSCSTTEPKFDLRISGYVLSWGEMKTNKEKGKQISWCSLVTPSSSCSWGNIQTHLVDMDIFHVMCTRLEVARRTTDLWRNQGLVWPPSPLMFDQQMTQPTSVEYNQIASQMPIAVMIRFTNLHLSLVGLLSVEPEALSRARTSSTAGSLLGWSLTNSSYEQRLDSNTRVIHLCDEKERAVWIINAHHCTTAICQSEAILHLWLDYMYDSSSWAREMSAE